MAVSFRNGARSQPAEDKWLGRPLPPRHLDRFVPSPPRYSEADLYGWAAVTWRKHWEQRVGVVLARGRAGVLLAALQDRSERRDDGPELPLRPEPPATMEPGGGGGGDGGLGERDGR